MQVAILSVPRQEGGFVVARQSQGTYTLPYNYYVQCMGDQSGVYIIHMPFSMRFTNSTVLYEQRPQKS